jgi:hypothetical protein
LAGDKLTLIELERPLRHVTWGARQIVTAPRECGAQDRYEALSDVEFAEAKVNGGDHGPPREIGWWSRESIRLDRNFLTSDLAARGAADRGVITTRKRKDASVSVRPT